MNIDINFATQFKLLIIFTNTLETNKLKISEFVFIFNKQKIIHTFKQIKFKPKIVLLFSLFHFPPSLLSQNLVSV